MTNKVALQQSFTGLQSASTKETPVSIASAATLTGNASRTKSTTRLEKPRPSFQRSTAKSAQCGNVSNHSYMDSPTSARI